MSNHPISILELVGMFPDDPTAEREFERIRWSDGIKCPRREHVNVRVAPKHPSMRWYCNSCRRYFSVKTGTVMQGSNLGCRVWALASRPKGVSATQLARDLGIPRKSAWFLAHRIREVWRELKIERTAGPVEVDETFIGGRERNKHARLKLRAGRGPVGKAPVVGMLDRTTNTVRTFPVESTNAVTLKSWVSSRVLPGTRIYTDDHPAYRGLPNHRSIAHSRGRYVDDDTHTNGIESHWALIKRGFKGTYHSIVSKVPPALRRRVFRTPQHPSVAGHR